MGSKKNFKEGFRKGVKTKFSFIIQKFLFNAVHFGTLGTNWVTLFSTNRVSGIVTVIGQCQGKPFFSPNIMLVEVLRHVFMDIFLSTEPLLLLK